MATAKKTTTKKKAAPKQRPIIVTTAHRGVFFGYTSNTDGDTIRLTKCRMCVYWDASMRGVLGLGSEGPGSACKISRPVDAMDVRNITAVIDVSPNAVARWESAPWA
jgi:hypothetical protein